MKLFPTNRIGTVGLLYCIDNLYYHISIWNYFLKHREFVIDEFKFTKTFCFISPLPIPI